MKLYTQQGFPLQLKIYKFISTVDQIKVDQTLPTTGDLKETIKGFPFQFSSPKRRANRTFFL